MNSKNPADRILDAFRNQWKKEDQNRIKESFCSNTDWTEFMLGNGNLEENAFLYRVSERLSLDINREWYTLDCVYYKKESNQINGHDTYPACLDIIIEHENCDHVQYEIYKLMLFRSPLKVLIFYDWNEYEKERSEKRRNWLSDKLSGLLKMGSEFGARWPEAADTEYLFLVGNRLKEGELPHWRHMTVKSRDFERLSQMCPSEYLYRLWI
ncbi:MAG: hypothetical protein F4Y85_02390 [Gammaproteobacteria bacterium]|nr:hypothetical protein [Gammaproteobacteria bacterium]